MGLTIFGCLSGLGGYLLFNLVKPGDYQIMKLNYEICRDFIFRSVIIFKCRSEEVQNPGHA